MDNKSLVSPQMDIALKLDTIVGAIITQSETNGFEKAYHIADGISKLKEILNKEYMKPIMALQGNRLGFKTDKDATGGYSEEIVKNCLIEAVLTGVQPYGNQFNIIAGSCYITKEGFEPLLARIPSLSYEIIPMLPRINTEKTSAAIVMKIKWTYQGVSNEREIDFAIKVNQYMGADAVIGKAERKARAWLFKTIKGVEIGDGDTTDIDYKLVPDYKTQKEEKNDLFAEKLKAKAEQDKKPTAGEQTTIV